jgi:hypothetical protein
VAKDGHSEIIRIYACSSEVVKSIHRLSTQSDPVIGGSLYVVEAMRMIAKK